MKLPTDLMLGRPLEETQERSLPEFVRDLRERMDRVHEFAREKLKMQSDKMKQHLDTTSTETAFEPGDTVWLYAPKRMKGMKVQNSRGIGKAHTFTKQIGAILKMSGLTGKGLKTVIESIQKFCETEKNTTEDRFSQIINELKTDIHNQEQQIKELLKTNKVLKSQISKEKRDRKKLKLHTKKMLLKERLSKKNNEGKNNISHKKSQFRNNLVENNSISNFSSAVQKQSVQQCHLQHCNEVCNENRRVVDNLIKQNRTLTEDNEQQKEQIKKLTSKYKQLYSEFTDCQNKIILLNCKMNEENSEDIFFTAPYEELHIYPVSMFFFSFWEPSVFAGLHCRLLGLLCATFHPSQPPIPVAGSRVQACIASLPAGCCNLLDKVWGVHICPAFCDLKSRNHTVDDAPPLHWPVGRVIEVVSGKDGVVRWCLLKRTKPMDGNTIKENICKSPWPGEICVRPETRRSSPRPGNSGRGPERWQPYL
ncbi:hypothetical protein NQ318_015932 [Aromia moschata]|uniref:DUF5641 domain-containing protein n=1 Tax=Aromia moschata TaxID=1265417 RepID=A0AAV8XJP0_9CUCU|nr:hypothetical protein NQ318_015932 [Aromia moschata]